MGTPAHTTEMMYDDAGQLYTVNDADDGDQPTVYFYEYDAVGNLIRSRMAPGDLARNTAPDPDPYPGDPYSIGPNGYAVFTFTTDLGDAVTIRITAINGDFSPEFTLETPSTLSSYHYSGPDPYVASTSFVANEHEGEVNYWMIEVYGTEGVQFNLDIERVSFTSLIDFDYTYDLAGNLTETTDSLGGTTSYEQYDGLNRLGTLKQSGAAVADKRVDFTYYDDGQFDTITRFTDLAGAAGLNASTYGYDDIGRLGTLSHDNTGGSPLTLSYSWQYDAAGRITQMTSPDGPNDYTYDNTDQLLTATLTNETYGYDDNGNRETANGLTYVPGSNNQIQSDGSFAYLSALSENCFRLGGQRHEAFGQVDDFSWERPRVGNRR